MYFKSDTCTLIICILRCRQVPGVGKKPPSTSATGWRERALRRLILTRCVYSGETSQLNAQRDIYVGFLNLASPNRRPCEPGAGCAAVQLSNPLMFLAKHQKNTYCHE